MRKVLSRATCKMGTKPFSLLRDEEYAELKGLIQIQRLVLQIECILIHLLVFLSPQATQYKVLS